VAKSELGVEFLARAVALEAVDVVRALLRRGINIFEPVDGSGSTTYRLGLQSSNAKMRAVFEQLRQDSKRDAQSVLGSGRRLLRKRWTTS